MVGFYYEFIPLLLSIATERPSQSINQSQRTTQERTI